MRQSNKIYRLFPKPRFFLIGAAVVAALWGYMVLVKGDMSGISAFAAAYLLMAGYMTVINASGALTGVLIPGEGTKYFRSIPNAYRNFRRAVLLNEILGILLAALFCLSAWLTGFGERKVYLLLIASEIIFGASHFSMRAKTKMHSMIVLAVAGGSIGGMVGGLLAGEEIPLFAIRIVAAVLGAVWVFSTVFFYKDFRKLWSRD